MLVNAEYLRENGEFKTSRGFIKAILCVLAHQRPLWLSGDEHVVLDNDFLMQSNSKNYHHFLPKAHLKTTKHNEIDNHIANITMVSDQENKKKFGAKAPKVYLKQIGGMFDPDLTRRLRTHLIELDEDGIWTDDYDRFIENRCERIAQVAKALLIPRKTDRAMPAPEDDLSEETGRD